MKTLQEKHLQGALDYDVLTHGCTWGDKGWQVPSWNEQRAFETFPSYDQVGAVLTLQTKTVLNVRFMIHIEWFFPDSLGDLTSPHSLMT